MSIAIRISDTLITDAKKYSRIDHRSLTGQIEHWAKIGKSAEENSELTYSQIKEILIGVAELDNDEKTEYQFG